MLSIGRSKLLFFSALLILIISAIYLAKHFAKSGAVTNDPSDSWTDHKRGTFQKGGHEAKPSPYGDTNCDDNPRRDRLTELLKAWLHIATSHNIQYVLFTGTLLGTIRNNDVIPWDSDIDLLVDVRYYETLKMLSVERGFDWSDGKTRLVIQPDFMEDVPVDERRRFSCEGKKVPKQMDQCSFQEPLGRLINGSFHVDLYHFTDKGSYIEDNQEDDPKNNKREDFYPLQPCVFMGLTAMCPNKPEKLLKRYFNTENLSSPYTCRDGKWLNRKGEEVDPLK